MNEDTVDALQPEGTRPGSRMAAARDLAERAARGELDAGIRAYEARKTAQRVAAPDPSVTWVN